MRRNRTARRVAQAVGAAVTGALLVGMMAPGAQAAPPPAPSTTSFCANVPAGNAFTDVTANVANINCLAFTEITTGLSGGTTYGPGGNVTRGQMASFIARMIDTANDLEITPLQDLPATGADAFTDDETQTAHEANINRLADAGVVSGIGGGLYAPTAPVSRAQMATFINNAQFFLSGDTARLTSTEDFFTDDEIQTAHEANINGLAGSGIVQGGPGGIAPTLYGPELAVNRSQMASFVIRYMALLESLNVIKPAVAPGTNATLNITPTAVATLQVAAPDDTSDDRQYTIAGLTAATDYTIQLFPAANIQGTSQFTFTELLATNTADEGAVAADITVVNGAVVVGPDDDAVVQAVGGQITFTVDGVAEESIVPVVYRDADLDGNLDLNADNTPVAAEPFGVGGLTRFLPPEAALGASALLVTSVTADGDAFTSGGFTYFMDGNDTFQYQGTPITQAQFDSILSVGDVGTASYNPDPAGVSVFNITTDAAVVAPAAPTVTVVNSGDTGGINDARITYTRPAANSPGVTYTLQRAVVTPLVPGTCGDPGDVVGAFANVATATQAAGTGTGVFVFSDNNVATGCYLYHIVATAPISGNTATSPNSTPATAIPGTGDTTAPTSVFTARTTDALSLNVDTGDVIKVVFSEVMAAPTAGTSVELTDGNGTIVVLGTGNASFALNAAPETVNAVVRPAGTVLTITVTAVPAPTAPGTTPGLQLPANVTNRIAVTDLAANGWNLGAGDITV